MPSTYTKSPSGAKKSRAQHMKLCFTLTFSILASLAFSSLLFLIPFIVDPVLSTIYADFVPVSGCRVHSAVLLNSSLECTWNSCKEGCTRDAVNCFQITVEYPHANTSRVVGSLFVNVRGCGYPPDINCPLFYEQYHYKFATNLENEFDCYYSRVNASVVVPKINPDKDTRDLLLATVIPISVFFISLIIVLLVQRIGKDKEETFYEGEETQSDFEDLYIESILPNKDAATTQLDGLLRHFIASNGENNVAKTSIASSAGDSSKDDNHDYLKRKSNYIEMPTLSKRRRRTEFNEFLSNYISTNDNNIHIKKIPQPIPKSSNLHHETTIDTTFNNNQKMIKLS